MTQQNSRKEYEAFLDRSETLHRKKVLAERGRTTPEAPKDAERAKFDDLLHKAQRSNDDVTLKMHKG
jgi:hypothetical protein